MPNSGLLLQLLHSSGRNIIWFDGVVIANAIRTADVPSIGGRHKMPAGDAQRTWFPEIVAVLRRDWNRSMPMAKLVELRDQLDAMLQSIRSERGILPPMMNCPKCGSTGRAAPPRVSVRAMILSLARFGIASVEEVQALGKSWNRYRRDEQLDPCGREVGRTKRTSTAECHEDRP